MSDPSAAMFHKTTSGNVNETELINNGRDIAENLALAQMQKLLGASAQDHTLLKDLDHFYTIMLRNVVPENCDDDDIVSRYQSVVGAIISVQHPLPVSTLSHLIDINVEEIQAVLDKLQSVIVLGGDNVPRVYHESFHDYVTDRARCKDPLFRIDPRMHHTQIATRCFEIMDKHLKRNILGLGDPARFMSNEDGLEEDGITDEQLEEKIPQQLRYACVYWVIHLQVANIEDADFMKRLKKFADEHMLHWFEVLSLIGNLDSAHHAIRVVLRLLKSRSSDLHELISDALRFISKFYETITRSALHTYCSAMPFTATDSLLFRRYNKEGVDNICGIEGGPEKWGALVANLSHGEPVNVVKFSLDSTLFVSWSEDHRTDVQRKLKIWDAATGTPISTIPGHRFAVANDFSTVASSEDKTITFYGVNGGTRGTVFTTPSNIQKLALSSDSSRVAAALSGDTVWLWESSNAELIDRFDGFGGSQLEFSPTGTGLAYSSAIGIQLRDGISGKFIADLRCGSSHQLEFSGDGSRMASLSPDDSLTLWNSESGALIATLTDVGRHGLAISTNGSLLATANHTQVTLWTENRNHLAQITVLDFGKSIRSMAFSLDNILAIGTYSGTKLYNVKTHSFISTLLLGGEPTSLAFSPDCTRFAAGIAASNVNLWDIRGVDACGPSSNATAVTELALSRDCSRLACGFEDGTVELWQTSPTKRRIASHQAHAGMVQALEFGPDGGLFASASYDGTIKLWIGGGGSLRGTLGAPSGLQAVALSNSMLVATCGRWHEEHYDGSVTLWSLDTLSPIHTFKGFDDEAFKVSIADNSTLVAVCSRRHVDLVVVNHTTIATFDVPFLIHTMSFLPDNSRLVAQSREGLFQSFNLINKHTTEGPTLEHLIQLPDIPLWHGVPIWHCQDKDSEQHYFSALFSQDKRPVPVVWIPREILVTEWIQGSSMIVLGCMDGRVIILRLPTTHVS